MFGLLHYILYSNTPKKYKTKGFSSSKMKTIILWLLMKKSRLSSRIWIFRLVSQIVENKTFLIVKWILSVELLHYFPVTQRRQNNMLSFRKLFK